MIKLLNFIGSVLMIFGVLAFLGANSAIHEIQGALGIGFGALVLSLGIVAGLLQNILDAIKGDKLRREDPEGAN
ncbi:MAG: hypothetical protein K2X84_07325 [Beijerinckiaceae bacterium]|nr:hypothetical protein [Beijerinckiaceae bacterium]